MSQDQLAHHQDEEIPVACVNAAVAGCTSCNGNTLLYVLLLVDAAEAQADHHALRFPAHQAHQAHQATLLILERLFVAAVQAIQFCHDELLPALQATDAISAFKDH